MRHAPFLLPLLTGCDPTLKQACEALADTPPSVEIGQGTAAFEPLEDGGTLPVDFGPQGGWHTYGTLRTEGLFGGPRDTVDDTTPLVTFTVQADDFSGGYTSLPRRLQPAPGGGDAALVGDLLILDLGSGLGSAGAAATLTAEVVDACGRAAGDTREVLLVSR